MRRLVHVQGHSEPLHITAWSSSCGDIEGDAAITPTVPTTPTTADAGSLWVAFEFGNSGGWVIALAELEAIVAEAKAAQAELAVLRSFIPKPGGAA